MTWGYGWAAVSDDRKDGTLFRHFCGTNRRAARRTVPLAAAARRTVPLAVAAGRTVPMAVPLAACSCRGMSVEYGFYCGGYADDFA